jgi:hypothetical protein
MSGGNRCFAVMTAAVIVMAGVGGSESWAVLKTWNGGGDGTSWSDGNNWTPVGVPVADTDDVTINTNAVITLGGTTHSLVGRTIVLNDCTLTNGYLLGATTSGALWATNVTFTSDSGVGTDYYQTPYRSEFRNCKYYAFVSQARNWALYYDGYLKIYGGSFANYGGISTFTYPGNRAQILFDGGGPHFVNVLDVHGWEYNGSGNGDATLTIRNTTLRVGTTSGSSWHYDNPVGDPNYSPLNGSAVVSIENSTNNFDNTLSVGRLCTLSVTNSVMEFWNTYAGNRGFYNSMTNSANFNGEGLRVNVNILRFGTYPDGAWFEYEAAGKDLGADFKGFHDNYKIQQLSLDHYYHLGGYGGSQKQMRLVNAVTNSGGTGAEALYADVLWIRLDMDLDLNGQKLYYKKLIGNLGDLTQLNGAVAQVTGAALIAASPYVHAPEGAKHFTIGDAPLAIGSDYGTLYVSGLAAGASAGFNLKVSGSQGNIDALRAELGGAGGGDRIQLKFPHAGDGGDMFFDWNFSHRSVTLDTLETLIQGTVIKFQ